jgi:hypothetical protein
MVRVGLVNMVRTTIDRYGQGETINRYGQEHERQTWSGRQTISSYFATGDNKEEAAEAETTIKGGGAKTEAKSKRAEQEESKKRARKEG